MRMEQGGARVHEITLEEVRACVFAPRPDDHKYRRGTVLLATGSERFPGAALLGVEAAVFAGAGMVRYLGPASLGAELVLRRPEAVLDAPAGVPGPRRADAVVFGSGVPDLRDDPRRRTAARVLSEAALPSGEAVQCGVADAGALPLVADLVNRGKRLGHMLLTPHAGELAVLLGAVKGSPHAVADIEADRACSARRAAARTGATVLLKGRRTLVAEPEGTVLSVLSPSCWLASAGTGDVLAGLIGALAAIAAQREPEERPGLPYLAAAAAWLHGRAAWLAAGSALGPVDPLRVLEPSERLTAGPVGGPITASELIRRLPLVIAALLADPEAG